MYLIILAILVFSVVAEGQPTIQLAPTAQSTLPNVTNDAQLKRSANDFISFPQKTTPVAGDVIIIEDSAASGVKKYITIGSLPTGTGSGTPSGASGQVQYNNAGAFGGSAGMTLSATQITGMQRRVTALSASTAITSAHGPIIACTGGSGADIIFTLPAVATAPASHYELVKVDAGTAACRFQPASGERINTIVNGTASAITQNATAIVDIVDTTTPNWSSVSGKSSIDLADLTPSTAASRLVGRGSASAGPWQEITLGTGLSMSGTTLSATAGAGVTDGDKQDITVTGSGATWTIDPNAVTYSKLQNSSASSILLGRGSSGAGAIQELTIGSGLTISGTILSALPPLATDLSKNHGDSPNLSVDTDTYAEVRVDQLTSASVNLDAPTGTVFEGKRLRYNIYSDVSRLLTYTQTTGGFAANSGKTFPPRTIAGAYLVMEFRWSVRSARWELIDISRRVPNTQSFGDVATIGINVNTTETALVDLAGATQTNYTFSDPVGTPYDGQLLRIRINTTALATAKPIIWGNKFTGNATIARPTNITGGGSQDNFGFSYNLANDTWVVLATTQNPIANKRRRCILQVGDEKPGALVMADNEIINTKPCRVFGNAIVEEIGIEAAGNFQPSAQLQVRTNNAPGALLLTGPLQAAVSGGYACARTAAGTGLATISCNASLQNNSIAAGDNTIGIVSGTANSATNLTVTISFVETP